ncbi:hypothetical protein R1CP_40465 (plasmid) [Rhodococcus opacus]|uniref:Uncharacterized protein n=1 Tax=Rhodococcus opacus TaxID=37919 RepID=A0A1B1KJ98_RHOOP|nr:hypothetical protein R1CP_40465 [Rhodococcus opacus]
MLVDSRFFELGEESSHETRRLNRCSLGFGVESIAHPVEKRYQRQVFVEVELDRSQPLREMGVSVAYDVFVD